MFRSFRNSFVAGLLLLAPLGVTIFVVNLLIVKIGKPVSNRIIRYLPESGITQNQLFEDIIPIISVFIVVLLVTALGFLSNYVLGKVLFRAIEKVIERVPFVNSVYNTVKQIVETFSKQKKAVFQKVVLVEYPRPGAYALGFLTGDSKGETQAKTSKDLVNIFVPTTPNPTSGFLLLIPKEDVMDLEMSVSDGMKLIISGGAVVPPYEEKKNAIPLSNPDEQELQQSPGLTP